MVVRAGGGLRRSIWRARVWSASVSSVHRAWSYHLSQVRGKAMGVRCVPNVVCGRPRAGPHGVEPFLGSVQNCPPGDGVTMHDVSAFVCDHTIYDVRTWRGVVS